MLRGISAESLGFQQSPWVLGSGWRIRQRELGNIYTSIVNIISGLSMNSQRFLLSFTAKKLMSVKSFTGDNSDLS